MNIVSVTVSAALMGIIAPGVAQMSIAPVIAQKRATNFGVAESRAVSYAALNDGAPQLTPLDPLVMPGCTTTVNQQTNAGTVTCIVGNQFKQSVSRSFRLAPLAGGVNGTQDPRTAYTPGVYCPLWDAWGIQSYNRAHNVQCIPVPYGPWAYTYEGPILW